MQGLSTHLYRRTRARIAVLASEFGASDDVNEFIGRLNAHGDDIISARAMLTTFLLRVRPASLASFLATVLRLNKRRLVPCKYATFFIDPYTRFGDVILNGEYEPQMREILHRHLSFGGVFIDLGANEGYFSVLASQIVGPTGTVIAIEPQSRLQHVISTNLHVNGCFNVRVIRCVVFNKSGKAHLTLGPTVKTGSSSLFRPSKCILPTEEVQSFSLSELIDRLGLERCDLLKVDIEGAEYEVFISATEVLRKGIFRNIALEIHHSRLRQRGLSADELHKHMVECGYELRADLGNRESKVFWVYSFSKKNLLFGSNEKLTAHAREKLTIP